MDILRMPRHRRRCRDGQPRRQQLWLEPLEDRRVLATFTVANVNDSGSGSLRDAIDLANANPAADVIEFEIPGAGVHTISPLTPLPTITDAVTIDGMSQPGYAGTPVIELSGAAITGSGVNGLSIPGSNSGLVWGSQIRGLAVNGFSSFGIFLVGVADAVVEGNHIGTDPTGTIAVPNGTGIYVRGYSNQRIVNNLVSGNSGNGVFADSGTSQIVIQGNRIGTDATGAYAIGNGQKGISFNNVDDSLVGGVGPGEGNLIAGNGTHGISIETDSQNNRIFGNQIGTDVSGTVAVPNGQTGVTITATPGGHFVGTDGDGVNDELEGNLISGNAGSAVWIHGVDGNVIAGNLIGTQADGNAALPNGSAFTILSGSDDTRIGTNGDGISDAAERNVIAGNLRGMDVTGDSTIIAGNLIGVGLAGAQLGNGTSGVYGNGVYLKGNNNRVGTDGDGVADADEANVIAYNSAGVRVGAEGTGNSIRGNSIHSNVGIEIDLAGDGVTLNDAGDGDTGPNQLQNYPVISYVADGPDTQITGLLNSQPNTTYVIDFYTSSSLNAQIREGETHVHELSVTTDAIGVAGFDVTLPVTVDPELFVTATATDPNGNTSEFSAGLRPEAVLTTITMPFDGYLSVGLYDADDQIIRTLREASFELAGDVTIGWDGRNDFGLEMPTGEYEWRALYSQAEAVDDGQVGDMSDQPFGITEHSQGAGAVAVDTSGSVYETSAWQEAHYELRKWDADGNAVWGINFVEGGKAIAVDNMYVYATRDAQGSNRIERFSAADGSTAPWSAPAGGHIVVNTTTDRFQGKVFGLSVDGTRLWVSNNLENRVEQYDVATGAFLDQFSVTDPKRLVADGLGNVWVADGSSNVTLFDESGVVLRDISGLNQPYAVTLGPPSDGSPNDNLYIGEVGSSQVVEFNLDTPTPTPVRSLFGAAEPGPITDDRLYWSITQSASLDVDSSGRMVVADGGNKRVLTYNPDGTTLRTRFSEFQPAPFVDPNVDPNMLLSGHIQYHVDYTTGEWAPSHNWLPADLEFSSNKSIRRRLSNGQDYLFYLGGGGPGERMVAVVYALEPTGMRRAAIIGSDTSGLWNWTDSDGDGEVEAAETTYFTDATSADFQTLAPGVWVDEAGTTWLAFWSEYPNGKTVKLELEGFDAQGNPLYNWSNRQDAIERDTSYWSFTPRNLRVHPGNGETYVIGNTSQNDDNLGVFWMGGTAVDRRAPDRSRIMLLPISGPEGQAVIHGSSQAMVAIATGDDPDYFYTGHAAGFQHWIRMYTTDGLLVATGIIGPNNGSQGGWIDHGMGLAAFTHPGDGTHYVYAEEVYYGKSIRYRVDDLHTVQRTEQTFQWDNPVFHVTNTLDDGVGSLRRAIENANSFPGQDTITFDIPGTGVHTISPLTELPMITDTVTIDGKSQSGYIDTPLIELHGGNITGITQGFLISSSESTVRGLTINGFSGGAIRTHGYPNNLTIEENFLGTDPTGSSAVPNGQSAIQLTGAGHQVIANLISGNSSAGISAGESRSLVIQGNRIGTDITGSFALPNVIGIGFNQVRDSLIGGSGIGEGNLISGNAREGIVLGGFNNTINNLVFGNRIGTDASGTIAIPNGQSAVFLKQSASGTYVGTNGDGVNDELEGNLISGNLGPGVYLDNVNSNVVAGNLIGTQIDGNSPLGNERPVLVIAGSANRIGTNGDGVSDDYERNIIAGNSRGILLYSGTTQNVIAGNLIGVGLAGAQLGNGAYGAIYIDGGATENRVGTDANGIADAAEANVIAYNSGGVTVRGTDTRRNVIRGNSIYSNLGMEIDLGDNGLTLNDADDTDSGPNELQNFPIITSATTAGGSVQVSGMLDTLAEETFDVDLYASASVNPTGHGGGEIYLGATTATTDASGHAVFTATLSAFVPAGYFVTATATDVSGNTSEYSLSVEIINGNQPPVAWDDSPWTDEDTALNGDLALLASDPDGDSLNFELLVGPSHGLVTVNPDGTYAYSPAENFHGTDSFDYEVNDGEFTATATIHITVDPVNDPATISGTALGVTDEDTVTPVTGSLSIADVDLGEDQFVPQSAAAGTFGTFAIDAAGDWTFTLNTASVQDLKAGDQVMDSLTVHSLDGTAEQIIEVTINGLNDAAVIGGQVARLTSEDETSETGALTITDVDHGEGSFVPQITNVGNHGVFDLDEMGNWIYQLDAAGLQSLNAADQVFDSFIVESADGTTAQVTFTIDGRNDAPVITSADLATLAENTNVVLAITATDVDQPPQPLTFSITGNGPDDHLFQIGNGDQLEFIGAPDFEFPLDAGGDNEYEVEVAVDDGNGPSTTQLVTVLVTEVNDNAPVFASASSISVAENSAAVQTVSASDADLPAQSITYSITGNGADDALFQITGGDHLEFIAPPNFENRLDADIDNVYEIELLADDGNGLTTTRTVFVTVTDVVESHSIYVLNESGRGALSLSGHAAITVGDIFVNSDSSNAIRASGHSNISVNSVNVVGGVRVTGNATIDPAPTALAAAVVDPLADMLAPTADRTQPRLDRLLGQSDPNAESGNVFADLGGRPLRDHNVTG